MSVNQATNTNCANVARALAAVAALPAPAPGAILVLACGNDLRGDDALGARFVAAVDAHRQRLPPAWQAAVTTCWQLQWGPETALLLAERRLALLIDAAIDHRWAAAEPRSPLPSEPPGAHSSAEQAVEALPAPQPALRIERLSATAGDSAQLLASVGTHRVTPSALLASAELLGVALPPALWLVAMAGSNFALGAPLSPQGEAVLEEALAWFWQTIVDFGAQERTRTSTPCGAGT